jgi:prepilin-type N-terminal cleavage/methylation domain-containing protein
MKRARQAFTLLEVLLATALLAAIATAALGWVASMGRAGRAAQTRLGAAAALLTSMRALNDDLLFAVAGADGALFRLTDERTLVITTSNRLPGEEPGRHTVTWRFAPDPRVLTRLAADDAIITPTPREVTHQLQDWRFVRSQNGELVVDAVVGPDHWRLACWSAGSP